MKEIKKPILNEVKKLDNKKILNIKINLKSHDDDAIV